MKIAFLFSGQGSQYPGMGKDLYEHYEIAKAMYDSVNLDFDLKKISFNGPQEQLNNTKYAQACIFMHSMVCASILRWYGVMPDVVAGLSLGEYSALGFADTFDLKDGCEIVQTRGAIMADALPLNTTKMAAVLMLDEASIKEACQKASALGVCEIANYNCPGQIVITGENDAVDEASRLCLEMGARRVIPLAVSGAFHSSLLKDAGDKLYTVLKSYTLHRPTLPIYHNISGKQETGDLCEILSKQIQSSVYFTQTIEHMLADGVDTFIEVGPGKTISGFVKKCTKGKDVKILHVEDEASLKACLQALEA